MQRRKPTEEAKKEWSNKIVSFENTTAVNERLYEAKASEGQSKSTAYAEEQVICLVAGHKSTPMTKYIGANDEMNKLKRYGKQRVKAK